MSTAYRAEVQRHAAALAQLRLAEDKIIQLTIRVFIHGGRMDKHESIRAENLPGVHPALLWNGDLVADQPRKGLILVNRNRYVVTPALEIQLRRLGWTHVPQAQPHEDAWVSPAMLQIIVREWMEAVR